MAFVTYGTADTRPTPILSRAFFAQPSAIMKAMREQSHECGIGQTTSGGGQGMAALEGIVAALEVCPSITPSVFYISRNPNSFAQHCLVGCFSHQPESSLSARIYLLRVRSHAVPPQRGVILLFHGAYPVDRHRIGYCHIMGKVPLV